MPQNMRTTLLFLILITLPCVTFSQRVVTFDPAKETVARRSSDGTLQLITSARAVALSIQEAIPQVTDIQAIELQKISKSFYVIARGRLFNAPETCLTIAILLAETSPDEFQADGLIISCTSSGDCRECSVPPGCSCTKGAGSCNQNNAQIVALKKVTLTLFD
jgi:hypothetical protein